MLRHALFEHGVAAVLIALGGGLGTYGRYATEVAIGHSLGATLLANVVGCFLLGLLLFDVRADELLSKRHRLLFGTGFCASFTTYSTFVLDAATSEPLVSIGYVLLSYAAGFAAILASWRVIASLESRPLRPPEAEGH